MPIESIGIKLMILLYAGISAVQMLPPAADVLLFLLLFVATHALLTVLGTTLPRILLSVVLLGVGIPVCAHFPTGWVLMSATLVDLSSLLVAHISISDAHRQTTGKKPSRAGPASLLAVVLLVGMMAIGGIRPFEEGTSLALLVLGICAVTSHAAAAKQADHHGLLTANDELRLQKDSLARQMARDREFRTQTAVNAQLEERNRIAQQIHDRVGHTISGSLMQLEAVKLLIPREPEKALSMVSAVIAILSGGLDSIRMTLRNVQPDSGALGLNRIRLLLEEVSARSGLRTQLDADADLSMLSSPQWRAILDNLTEALTNTERHGSATAVQVGIRVLNRMIRVEARDNGKGGTLVRKGMGLGGMEERMSQLGGQLLVDGSGGFTVVMLFPRESMKSDPSGNSEAGSFSGDYIATGASHAPGACGAIGEEIP